MFCEKCGNPVKDTEKFCSKCGAPINSTAGNPNSEEKASSTVEVPTVDTEKVTEAVAKTASAAMEGAKEVTEKGKKAWNKLSSEGGGKKKLVIIASAAVALVLLVVIVANAAAINNFFHKTFSSPAKYYQFVEKKTVNDLTDTCGELYNVCLDSLNYYDKSVSGEVSIELDEAGQDFVELLGLAGVDVSWLKSAKIGVDAAVKDNNFNAGISTAINKDDILSGKVVMDIQEGVVYYQVPELNKLYLGVDMEDALSSYEMEEFEMFQENQEANKEQLKAFPSEAKLEKLIKKYMLTALSCIDDVSKSSKTLKAEGVQQKCTELKVTIDAETAGNIAETVLEEVQNDKDIEKIISDIVEVSDTDLDAEEAYDAFLSEIDDMLDDLQSIADSDDEIEMKVYVDGKGNIKGRKIELKNEHYSQSMSIVMPQKGNKFGFELSMDASPVKLIGSGNKKGDTITGDFAVKYNGTSVVDIVATNLNTKELKKGRLNGKFDVAASSSIGLAADMAIGNIGAIISDAKLTLKAETTKNSSKYDVNVGYDGESIGTVSIAMKAGSGSKQSIPNAKNVVMVEDEEDLLEWVEEMNWDKLINILDKSDIPSDVVDMVEDIAEILEDGDIEDLYYLF